MAAVQASDCGSFDAALSCVSAVSTLADPEGDAETVPVRHVQPYSPGAMWALLDALADAGTSQLPLAAE